MSRSNTQERATHRVRYLSRSIIPLLILFLTVGSAVADLPAGEEIMIRRIEALGGEAALARHHNSVMKGTMSVSGVDMSATIYSAEPNLSYTLFESEMIGRMESGCNGEVAWDMSTMQGASAKEGKELEKAIFDAAFNAELHWRDRYTSIDVQGEEELDGVTCYKVVLAPAVGDSITAYVDAETWLTVRTETVSNSDMGSISIVADPSDYREVDGVKVPFSTKIVLMGAQEMTTTIESIEFNVEIPEGVFDVPEEVQELIAARQPTTEG
jgi:outer membrane lipoprotein-sorting protein